MTFSLFFIYNMFKGQLVLDFLNYLYINKIAIYKI